MAHNGADSSEIIKKRAMMEKRKNKKFKAITHIPWDPRVFSVRNQNAWLNDPGVLFSL